MQAKGGVFWLEAKDQTQDLSVAVISTLLVNQLYAHVLFNLGATHSFVNTEFAKKLVSKFEKMDI